MYRSNITMTTTHTALTTMEITTDRISVVRETDSCSLGGGVDPWFNPLFPESSSSVVITSPEVVWSAVSVGLVECVCTALLVEGGASSVVGCVSTVGDSVSTVGDSVSTVGDPVCSVTMGVVGWEDGMVDVERSVTETTVVNVG